MAGQLHWIVAKTKPSRDFWAAENVARLGRVFYLPKIYVQNRRYARAEPLFPSHLFVLSDGSWRFLLSTFGISGVMLQGTEPAIVPDREIDKLRKLENEDGFIVLPDRLVAGQAIRIKSGSFEGQTGVYQGLSSRERVIVLVNLLGRKTTVLIDEAAIEAA